jgi:release factor glutamine methyltransferase
MLLKTLLKIGIDRLQTNSTTPIADAQYLLAYTIKKDRIFLLTWPEKIIDDLCQKKFFELIEKRRLGWPVAYLIGTQSFWSFELTVTPDTLIPRPETEHLVVCALEKLNTHCAYQIVDLGTGSGAVGLAIAKERPCAEVFATDKSTAALRVAKLNACQLAIQNIHFYQGSWCKALPMHLYDLIVSNPPYIARTETDLLSPEVYFEPSSALFSEEEGLKDIHSILEQSLNYLKPNGWLLIEHGFSQAQKVRLLFEKVGFQEVFTRKDYSGHERVTGGKRYI